MNAREAYYRRMAQRYRELAAGSPDLEMAEGWRAAADECDKLAEAMNASPPESDPPRCSGNRRSDSNKRNFKTKPKLSRSRRGGRPRLARRTLGASRRCAGYDPVRSSTE